MTGRERYRSLSSLLEVPILNEKYWSKVPGVAADAIVMDMEDSAPPDAKQAVRDKVHAALDQRAYFGGRKIAVRVNNLATPWGRLDLQMLSAHDADVLVCYPKAGSVEEMSEVIGILSAGATPPEVWAMIESTQGLAQLDAISRIKGLVGLHFGYTDLAAEMAMSAFDEGGLGLTPLMSHAAHRISLAAAANGLFATGGTMIPDYRDLAKVETFIAAWAMAGYTGCFALSPAHVSLVNRVFRLDPGEAERALAACAAFEEAVAGGAANAEFAGRLVTLPDYRRMQALLARGRLAEA